jgi:AcrR family transcriptional regulator
MEAKLKKPSPRERLLAAADELFYSEGIHTVGIDRIIEKAGVAKGSLYYNFDGKDALVREYLLGRHAAWAADVDHAVAAATSPEDKVLAIFDVLGTLFAKPDFRGCTFANAIAEAQPGSPEVLAAVNFRSWVHELFGGLVANLPVEHPEVVTKQLVILYDGAVATAQMDSAPEAASIAKDLARRVIDSVSVVGLRG